MTDPLFRKVDCIRLAVNDLADGLSFYRDRLELVWQTPQAAGLRMPNDVTEIVLHTESKAPEIDMEVFSADDAARQFEKAGGKVKIPPFDIQIGRCVVVHDPWGNELVLLDPSKGLLVTDADGHVVGNAPPAEYQQIETQELRSSEEG